MQCTVLKPGVLLWLTMAYILFSRANLEKLLARMLTNPVTVCTSKNYYRIVTVFGVGSSLWFYYCLSRKAIKSRKPSGEEGEICR